MRPVGGGRCPPLCVAEPPWDISKQTKRQVHQGGASGRGLEFRIGVHAIEGPIGIVPGDHLAGVQEAFGIGFLLEAQLPVVDCLPERLTDAQISALIDGLLTFLRSLTPAQLEALLGLADAPALDQLTPLALDLLRGIAGADGAPMSHQADVLGEARRLVGTCDTKGALELIDIGINQPNVLDSGSASGTATGKGVSVSPELAHGGGYWTAFNARTRQMVAGLDTPGVAVQPGYLATFSFRPVSWLVDWSRPTSLSRLMPSGVTS